MVFIVWLRMQYTLYGDAFALGLFRAIQGIARGKMQLVEIPATPHTIKPVPGMLNFQGGTFYLHDLIAGDKNVSGDAVVGDKVEGNKTDK